VCRGSSGDSHDMENNNQKHEERSAAEAPHVAVVAGRLDQLGNTEASKQDKAEGVERLADEHQAERGRQEGGGDEDGSEVAGHGSGTSFCDSARRLDQFRLSGDARRLAEHGPIHVWAEFLAADARGMLNHRALLSRNGTHAAGPLVHGRWRDTQQTSECSLRAGRFRCSKNGVGLLSHGCNVALLHAFVKPCFTTSQIALLYAKLDA
jgi:hypothetical protein